jgi:membrane protease YdiL (CAAX protease family)
VETKLLADRSPLSPGLWPSQAFSFGRSAALLAALVAAFAIALFLGVASVMLLDHHSLQQSSLSHLTVGVLGAIALQDVPVLLVILVALPVVAGRSLRALGLHWPQPRDLAYGLAGTVAMFLATQIAAVVQSALLHTKVTETSVELFSSTTDPRLLAGMVVVAVVIAPITEELVFRGFLFNALHRYFPVWIAIVLSSLMFGLLHGLTAWFPLGCAGAVLALVYYRSGSLTAAMLTHALFNATSTALLLATHGKG